jgi:hypothetical protein
MNHRSIAFAMTSFRLPLWTGSYLTSESNDCIGGSLEGAPTSSAPAAAPPRSRFDCDAL